MKTIVLRYDGHTFVPQQKVTLPAGFETTVQVDDAPPAFVEPEFFTEEEYGSHAEILNLSRQFPPDPNTPRDLAAQHDHYLHGTPKRPENELPLS